MVPVIGLACSLTDEGAARMGSTYVRALQKAGGIVLGISPYMPTEQIERLGGVLSGIVLSGGPDIDPYCYGEEIRPENGTVQPLRDRLDLALARWALEANIPVLGICRGLQVLNVAAGGSLYQDIPSQTDAYLQHRQKAPRWYATHAIELEPGSRLAQILGAISVRVNSFHHQAVQRLAPGFRIAARATDGIVEAIEATDHPFAIGVQWHPEDMVQDDPVQERLFRAFVEAAAQAAQSGTVGEHAG